MENVYPLNLDPWLQCIENLRPKGLKVPTWVTLKNIPREFLNVATEMAERLGDLLGNDRMNAITTNQIFFVSLVLDSSYKLTLRVINEST
jgi:hypothetical protein